MELEKIICVYYQSSTGCRFGTRCKFIHEECSPESLHLRNQPIPLSCKFYQNGYCRAGESCRYQHDTLPLANDAAVNGRSVDRKGSSTPESETTCIICLDPIETFGLLSGCDHHFCISCISAWRNPKKSNRSTDELRAKRGCPVCRQESDFVMPSNVRLSGSQKEILFKKRLSQRKSILCRDWVKKKKCKFVSTPHLNPLLSYLLIHFRFGSKCHYAHLDINGNDCKPLQSEEEASREQRRTADDRLDMQQFIEFLQQVDGIYEDDDDGDFGMFGEHSYDEDGDGSDMDSDGW
jgi:E3 ubiquitin-protein ligase makorin